MAITLKFLVLIEDTDQPGNLSSIALLGEKLQLKQIAPGKTTLGRTITVKEGEATKEVFQTFIDFPVDIKLPEPPKPVAAPKAAKKAVKAKAASKKK